MAASSFLLTSCGSDDEDEGRPGFWFDERPPLTASDLGALGYAPGYEVPDTDWTGLRVHDPDRAVLVPLLLSSGHEAAAYVLAPDGTLEKRWAPAEDDPLAPEIPHPTQQPWRRVEPLPDGGLLAIHEGVCLLRLDAESRIVWSGVPGAHHDLMVEGDEAWVLDRTVVRPVPGFLENDSVLWREYDRVEDGIARVDLADGSITTRLPLSEILEEGGQGELVRQANGQANTISVKTDGFTVDAFDPFHANSLLRLPDRPDEVVVFLREVGALMAVETDERRLAWLQLGPWQGAHDPTVDPAAPDERLLLFDNHGRADPAAPASRIVAIDRATFGTTTFFEDTPPTRFHSPVCGAVTPLGGGVWLVVEATAGRAFQIDASGEIVWEFRSPFRVEGEGLVAVLLDLRPL